MKQEENKRSPYQQEMDQIHIPKEKADETLRLMLEENKKLRQQKLEKTRNSRLSLRLIPVVCAAAACLALIFSGVLQQNRIVFGNAAIPAISRSGQPASQAARDETPGEKTVKALFPGWNASEAAEDVLLLEKDGTRIYAMILQSNSDELKDLMALPISKDPAARFTKDPDTGALGALFEKEGSCILLFARNLEEDAFVRIVREAVGS